MPIPFVGSSVSQLIGAGASGADGVTYEQNPESPPCPPRLRTRGSGDTGHDHC